LIKEGLNIKSDMEHHGRGQTDEDER